MPTAEEISKKLPTWGQIKTPPVENVPGVPSRFEQVDLVIVRENTEDLYAGLEHTVVPGVVESLKIITKAASERIALFAFEHARRLYGLVFTERKDIPLYHPDVRAYEVIDEASGRVTVMINIFGRSTPVELEYWQIEAL